MKSLSSRNL